MPGERRQERAVQTRAQLLAAAREVFETKGFQGASVAAITDVAATAHGTFYLYFKNKEEVFVEVMASALNDVYEHSFVEFDDNASEFNTQHHRERVAGFISTFVAHRGLWRALLEAVLASPVVEQQWLGLRTRFHARLATRIETLQTLGLLEGLDARYTAYALTSMVEWIALTGTVFSSPVRLDTDQVPDALIDTISDLWLRALLGSALQAD